MQIDALHALFGLHANQRGLRGEQRELALRHEAQIGAANLELRLHDVVRTAVIGEGLREDLFAFAGLQVGLVAAWLAVVGLLTVAQARRTAPAEPRTESAL